MLIITNVEYTEVENGKHYILHHSVKGGPLVSSNVEEVREVQRELISGRRFRRPSDGVEIVLGSSKAVQEIFGIPAEAWETQESLLKETRQYLEKAQEYALDAKKELRTFKNMSFWTKLSWAFSSSFSKGGRSK